MGSLQSPPIPPNQYPIAIQLKLYQAFIFSIPILFSIILFLLFYLFYLKRRAYGVSSRAPVLPQTNNDANIATTDFDSGSMNELKNKLCRVIFDEDMEARELLCCVCLGEYEAKEELVEVETCKHMFHGDCIRHWFRNHSTCPLCRVTVLHHHHHHHNTSHTPPNSTTESIHQQGEMQGESSSATTC